MTQLKNLFEPITIGSMELKNRIVMAPMTVDYANDDETPSDRHIAYYVERAKGGVGLITMEVVTVDEEHRYQQHSLGLYNDDLIPHHKKLVDAVHAHGAKIMPQISHTGPESLGGFYKGIQPVGPSVVRTQTTMQVCRELDKEEIPHYVSLYGDAARRAEEAGYDGIELHAAHSYMLIGSFLSPLRNLRTDEYGGKLEGRMRFLLEVLKDIRSKVSADFPIHIRLSGNERESGGRDINETVRMAPVLVEAGINAFHVSGGVGDANITQIIPSTEYPNGYNVNMATAIKQVVDVPVMAVGRNVDVYAADELVKNKQVDMVVMGRALFADPYLPNKAKENLIETIRPCNVCQDCVDTIMKGGGSACALNPHSGRELLLPMHESAEQSKKALVIGGGVAGLEAARVAAERGHQVTLLEKSDRLGGDFLHAVDLLSENGPYLQWLQGEVERLGVTVELSKNASLELVKGYDADAIIVATGGSNTPPPFEGDEQSHVVKGDALKELIENDFAGVEGDVVVLGGNVTAVEVADAIARKNNQQALSPVNRHVTLINWQHRVADGAGKKRRGDVMRRLDLHGVHVLTGMNIKKINSDSVVFETEQGVERHVPATTVIVADQMLEDKTLFEQLQGLAEDVYAVGDCDGFGLVKKAIRDATEAAYAL